MSNANELSKLASVIQQNRTNGTTQFNEAGAIRLPVGTTAQRPATPVDGMTRFNTTNGQFDIRQDNQWAVLGTEVNVLAANVTSSPAFASGAGTQASPYVIPASNTQQGGTRTVATVTVTGLPAEVVVPIVDLNAGANGNRFSFSNFLSSIAGVLVFDIVFTDNPISPANTAYTLLMKIGYGSVYVSHVETTVPPPGFTWIDRTSGTTEVLYDIVWGDNKFVAVGSSGTIITSPDGITWTSQTSGTTQRLEGVFWGDKFVAVGNSGTIITSPDGITWTSQTSGTTQLLKDATWNGTLYVIVGHGGVVLYSSDAISWTITANSLNNDHVIWDGVRFLAIDESVDSSSDGITWSRLYTLSSGASYECLWDGSQYVLCGSTNSGDPRILTTPDFMTVTERSNPGRGENRAISWNGSIYVVVGNQKSVVASFDSISWSQRIPSPDFKTFFGVAWSPTLNRFVAVGNLGMMASSD